jgi:hypothetical protein
MRTINQYVKENKNKVKITSVNVNAFARPINTIWTPEMVQDISAFHNIDAEAELSRILNEELTRSIDNQILRDLFNNDLH